MSKELTPLKALREMYQVCLVANIADMSPEFELIEKELKALEIIKECFDFNGFEEFIPNSKWYQSVSKQKLLKEVLL